MQPAPEATLYADARLVVTSQRVGLIGVYVPLEHVERCDAVQAPGAGTAAIAAAGLSIGAALPLLISLVGLATGWGVLAMAPAAVGVGLLVGSTRYGLQAWKLWKGWRLVVVDSSGVARVAEFDGERAVSAALATLEQARGAWRQESARRFDEAAQVAYEQRQRNDEAARHRAEAEDVERQRLAVQRQQDEANRRRREAEQHQQRAAAELASRESDDADRAGKLLARIRVAKGPAARRTVLQQGLQELKFTSNRQAFVRQAAALEVKAAHEKTARLVDRDAKRRVYEATLKEMQADDVPDDLQAEALADLEAAIRSL